MKHTLSLIFILFATFCNSQNGKIKGTLIDETGESVIACIITLQSNTDTSGTMSNLDGYFEFKNLEANTYDLTFNSFGDSMMITGVEVDSNKTTFLDSIIFDLPEFIGCCFGPSYTIPLISDKREDTYIARKPYGYNDKELKNIYQTPFIPSSERIELIPNEFHYQGSRTEHNLYYLDGIKCRNTQPNLPRNSIHKVTHFTNGTPACYGDFTGELILIETKFYHQ